MEEKYKVYKLNGYLDDKAKYIEKHGDYNGGTIVSHFKKEFNISDKDFEDLTKKYADIPFVKGKYTKRRREDFRKSPVEFYDWFKGQNNQCGYCGISQAELYEIFQGAPKKLPLNNKLKRSSGTLEIERLDSSKDYSDENIILACPLCNNAKSNLIDEVSWRKFFVEPMRQYYEHILGKRLLNKKPE